MARIILLMLGLLFIDQVSAQRFPSNMLGYGLEYKEQTDKGYDEGTNKPAHTFFRSSTFNPGTVKYFSDVSDNVPLKYDIVSDKLLTLCALDGHSMIQLYPYQVDYFNLDSCEFWNIELGPKKYGYYQYLGRVNIKGVEYTAFKKWSKQIMFMQYMNGSIMDKITHSESYYLGAGSLSIKNRRGTLKQIKFKEFKKYFKDENLL